MTNLTIKNELTEFLLYTTPNSDVKVEIYMHNETVWLSQKAITELFGVDRIVITKHLKNIFESKELKENSVSAKIAHTAKDGKNYQTKFYDLDAILLVGYRVNPSKATQFRIWASKILKDKAKQKAFYEYNEFNKKQKIQLDFDKMIQNITCKEKN